MVLSTTISNQKILLTKIKKFRNFNFLLPFLILNLLNFRMIAQEPDFKVYESKLVLKSFCQLGEGSFWDSKRKKLWFVDIERGEVHHFIPKSGQSGFFKTGQKVGTLVPSFEKDEMVLGLQDGIYKSDLRGTQIQKIAVIQKMNSNQRLNDGKCDPNGLFWVGSLNMGPKSKDSHLFHLDESEKVVVKLDSVSISNGIVWSKDKKKMYYIDTPTRTIQSFDFDMITSEISNRRVVVHTPDSLGWPDGMAIDDNDNLWIGMWGGFCVSIWSPKTGKMVGRVNVAAKNVTSCAFGGDNEKTLYITTAREGLKKEELEKYPLSGCLFKSEVGISGPQMSYWVSGKK